jgi:hypothetical protein
VFKDFVIVMGSEFLPLEAVGEEKEGRALIGLLLLV